MHPRNANYFSHIRLVFTSLYLLAQIILTLYTKITSFRTKFQVFNIFSRRKELFKQLKRRSKKS